LALPALPIIFKRSVDIYDGIQTLVLVIFFYRWSSGDRNRRVRSVWKGLIPRRRTSISRRPRVLAKFTRSEERQLYQRLLNMALGDEGKVKRLIESMNAGVPRMLPERNSCRERLTVGNTTWDTGKHRKHNILLLMDLPRTGLLQLPNRA
jgi:hypothetical protein